MVVIKEIQELVEEEAVSSSNTAFDKEHEVFLSFRGEDTRFGFTDHLHKALIEADINTFLDDECIETGEDLKPELEKAIKQSRASIIVLSKNYASSTWCLNELVLILEQRRKFGMIVLPIFYHVDPSHVRKQEDSFAEALKKHEKSIEAETDLEKKQQKIYKLKIWKDALSEVADLKGKDIKGWHETRFIEQIVNEIDRRLDRKVSCTSQDLIGMWSQIGSIESWLKDGSKKDVDFTTICGMGGIGKTTLAKYIYDKNFGLFENSCFLENIGTISSSVIPDGKLSLQKQLLKEIKGKQDISRVGEGTIMIEKALLKKQVFLVLDDIDNVDQLDALLGTKGFCPGSKIIITTRDRLLTKKCKVWNTVASSKNYSEILLEGLDMNESLELLSRHVFGCNSPKVGYEEPSRKAVEYCEGHPLALKVLGSSLFQRDVSAWEDTLELLEKESNLDIHSVLKISFDSLSSENDKKLFKYIACFFVGKDTDFIGKILKECDIRTSSGIPNLVDKCLLTVDPVNCVEMHQLLQDMGRHIVHQESLAEPWKRSILCCHKEAFDVLKEDKGTEKTQGLLLDKKIIEKKFCGRINGEEKNFEDEHSRNEKDEFQKKRIPLVFSLSKLLESTLALLGWLLVLLCSKFYPEEDEDEGNLKTESFTKMKNLVLLQLNYVQLTGSYEKFPKRIRWLCWHGFPSQYIPPECPMTKLVVLDMSRSNLEGLWKAPKLLTSLKILNLSNSLKLIRTGDFSLAPNLEQLILAGCSNLVEICESIGELRELALLDLSCCVRLRKVPRNMSKLRKMTTLSLYGCCNLFKTLVVPQSPQSSWLLLPHSIVKLNLSGNDLYNESFPVDFSSLSSLRDLNLSGNPMDSLPDCVRSLSRITALDISKCKNLKSALDLPSSIISLRTYLCGSLEVITFDSASSNMRNLGTLGCNKLKEARYFCKCEPMEKVGKAIIERLGWSGLGFSEHQEMLYEKNLFSTCFPGNQVPHSFTYKTNSSSISFIVPPSPNNHNRIRGLNVCFVKTVYLDFSATIIVNMTSNREWIYGNKIEELSKYEDIVLMNHWMFEDIQLNVGDEVYIQHFTDRERFLNSLGYKYSYEEFKVGYQAYVKHCKHVKGCGVDIVYDEDNSELQDTETDPLDYYKSWKDRTGYPPLSVYFDNRSRSQRWGRQRHVGESQEDDIGCLKTM